MERRQVSAISGRLPRSSSDQCPVAPTTFDEVHDRWTASQNKPTTASGWMSIDRRLTGHTSG